jgi:hypothetical protein
MDIARPAAGVVVFGPHHITDSRQDARTISVPQQVTLHFPDA